MKVNARALTPSVMAPATAPQLRDLLTAIQCVELSSLAAFGRVRRHNSRSLRARGGLEETASSSKPTCVAQETLMKGAKQM